MFNYVVYDSFENQENQWEIPCYWSFHRISTQNPIIYCSIFHEITNHILDDVTLTIQ